MEFTTGRTTTAFLKPYLIAEIGVNHGGDLAVAKSMVSSAAQAGADAVKFQTYKAELLASESNSPAYWDLEKESTTSQFELFKKYDSLTEDDYSEIASYSRSLGVDFMSTPFDEASVDFLAPIVSSFKIASADITNVPLIRSVAKHGKPVILSTGAASIEEVGAAIDELSGSKIEEICVLHCVLNYPTLPEDAQLLRIRNLQAHFGQRSSIGYSDHVPPTKNRDLETLVAASFLGARVIEKHFTLDINSRGNDHYHSATQGMFLDFRQQLENFRSLLGDGGDHLEQQSSARTNARRRVFAKTALKAGQIIRANDLIALRANIGLEVAHWDSIVGKTVRVNLSPGTAIVFEHLLEGLEND